MKPLEKQNDKPSIATFADLEARIASDADGSVTAGLISYLEKAQGDLLARQKDATDSAEKQQLKKLHEATDAACQIIKTVWTNFHPSRRLPLG